MTHTNLEAQVKRIAELDAKRTQGEWVIASDSGANVWTEIENTHIANCMLEVSPNTAWCNAAFIAAAPQMAAIIRDLWGEREQQREVIRMAREALRVAVPYVAGSYKDNLRIPRDKENYDAANKALAALDAALGTQP